MSERSADRVQIRRLLGKFWTFANVLSLVRLVLVFPIAYLILYDGPMSVLFALLIAAIVTDWFDGRVARWSDTVSDWGKVLDPVADKVAAVVVTLALVVRGSLPVWLLVLIGTRDILIVLGGVVLARRTQKVVMSLWVGKFAVTMLALTILAALLEADEPIIQTLVWTTAISMVFAFLLYVVRFIHLISVENETHGKSLDQDEPRSVSVQ